MTTLSRTIVQAARAVHYDDFSPEVCAKVKIALLDMLSCVYESLDLPQSVQAIEWAARAQGEGHCVRDTACAPPPPTPRL